MAGKYTRVREIGRGGMGSVWLGRDTVLDRPVALKRVGLVPGGSTPDLERAEREARLAAALNHPHVVAVFDLVAEGDEHWLVMEHVDGTSLAELIRRKGPMSSQAAGSVLWQAADALAAAHAAGIVHRDVKPSNILVTADGEAKLTDFGIARAEADASLTQTGLVTGSPAYLSPEVASGQAATTASDVWALGATLFHALDGRPPYDVGENVLAAMYQIVHEDPPRLGDGGWVAAVLEHTMVKEPGERWSAEQVRDVLRRGAAGEPMALPTATRTAPLPPAAPSEHTTALPPADPAPGATPPDRARPAPAASDNRSRWLWPVGVVAVLALSLLAFAIGLRDGDEDEAPPAAAERSAEPSATPSPSESESEPESASPSPTTDPEPRAAEMEAFVSGYLETVTQDPRATWGQLTPAFQQASGNFGRYNGFWRTIDDITLLDINADPDSMTVSYRVRYDLRSGGTTTDDVTLQLEADGDGFQVAGES